jgi:hypothetical protein
VKLRVKIGDAEVSAQGSPSFISGIVGKFYCLVLGKHKRGKFSHIDRLGNPTEEFNVYVCQRCFRETRYKVKPNATYEFKIAPENVAIPAEAFKNGVVLNVTATTGTPTDERDTSEREKP